MFCLPGLSLLVSALFVGHAAFLFISLPGLSLLVSALFRWACSISIHLSPSSVTAGVRPFPSAMQHFCSLVSHVISFFLSFRFGACTAVFCPVRWNRFACERFLLLCKGCVTVSGIAFLPHCVTLSALFSFSGKRWMNDRIGFRWRGSDLSVQLGRRAYVRHQKSISCHILRSSRFCFLSSRGQLPAD